jgi:hypothetical protein
VSEEGHAEVDPPPQNGFPDLPIFDDPMRGKGQPPAPTGLPNFPILDGLLQGNCGSTFPSGNYYAADNLGRPTGAPITTSGCVNLGSPGGFNNFVFFGGLDASGTVTFAPGRYILAGSKTGEILTMRDNSLLQDYTPLNGSGESVRNTDAGEIFIFTDTNYPGLQVPAALTQIQSTLHFGDIYVQWGNHVQMNLHGLNGDSLSLPSTLKTFAPTVFWQDQRNSTVKYKADGSVDFTSCEGGHSLDLPCPNTDVTVDPSIVLQASSILDLYGLLYQPRGSAIEFQGNGHIISPLQLVTGALSLQGGPTVELLPLSNPLRRRMVALVE